MSSSPLKVLLLVFEALLWNVGLKPPQPPENKFDRLYSLKGQVFEDAALSSALVSRLMVTMLSISNAVVLLSFDSSNHPYFATLASYLCHSRSSAAGDIMPELTHPFLVGFILLTIGALIRIWCFVTLDRLFTFQVTVRKDHALVTTGPYAVVRHPSYTGLYLMLLGATLTFFTRGSHVAECGVMRTPVGWLIGVGLLSAVWSAFSTWKRCDVEDALMAHMFEEEWVRYGQRVSYKLIPGVH